MTGLRMWISLIDREGTLVNPTLARMTSPNPASRKKRKAFGHPGVNVTTKSSVLTVEQNMPVFVPVSFCRLVYNFSST
jgi:hypothetical protein